MKQDQHQRAPELGERLWAAGKAAAASAAGPAGVAIGGALLLAASGGALSAMLSQAAAAPEAAKGALIAGQLFPMAAGAVCAAYGLLASAPLAAASFVKSLSGHQSPEAPTPKEAFEKAWSTLGRHLGYGALSIGLGAASAVAYATLSNAGAPSAVAGGAAVALMGVGAGVLFKEYEAPANIAAATVEGILDLKDRVSDGLQAWRAARAERSAAPSAGKGPKLG